MVHAFETTLKKYSKAIIIGSDCPEISPDIINEAFTQLDSHDVVIGPTYDGGYYLLGMNEMTPELFKNIAWSTETVFDQTIEIIKNAQLSHAVLEKLSDLDYLEDLEKFPAFQVNKS